jgi:hypothetical protein
MGIQGGDRFVEIGWCSWQLGQELLGSGIVVEMHRNDFCWFCGSKMNCVLDRDGSTVRRNQFFALSQNFDGKAIQQDSSSFNHEIAPNF